MKVFVKSQFQQFLFIIQSNNKYSMESEQKEAEESTYKILHHTKQKYKHMTATILLTSSLINSKNKLGKLRQDKQNNFICLNPSSYKQILKTKKISLKDNARYKTNGKEDLISNINRLKSYAKKLDEDLICKLDKENQQLQEPEPAFRTLATLDQPFTETSRMRSNPKSIKSKIAKGRPEMYAKLKRRKILMDLRQNEQNSFQSIANHQNNQPLACQIVTKNSLLKYISNYNSKGSNKNMLQRIFQQKGEEAVNQKKKFFAIRNLNARRCSVACFKNYENMGYISKGKIQNDLWQKGNNLQKLSIRNPRHSISNTIE